MKELSLFKKSQVLLANKSLRPIKNKLEKAVCDQDLSFKRDGNYIFFDGSIQNTRENWLDLRTGSDPYLAVQGSFEAFEAKLLPASISVFPLLFLSGRTDLSQKNIVELLLQKLLKQENDEAIDFSACFETEQELSDNCGMGLLTSQTRERTDSEVENISISWFWCELRKKYGTSSPQAKAITNVIFNTHTLWFSPYTGKKITPKEALSIIKLSKESWEKNALPSHCYGAQYWNHPSINATFCGPTGEVRFHDDKSSAVAAAKSDGGRILSWAGRTDKEFEEECSKNAVPLIRIEDGFLRSVGLGAGLARGAMLAADDLGIYYDPARPSRLEVLLKNYVLSPEEMTRASLLVEKLRQNKVSKYNFGRSRGFRFPTNKRKILVPGQVADDAAIRKSRSNTIKCETTPNVNLDLIRLARKRSPNAFLIYKPHPDVETGLRKGHIAKDEALKYVDSVASDANIIDVIEAVDEVETFSSLAGFEALLRGKDVVVHGTPFYAGWGVTRDLTPNPERTAHRTLDEIVFIALVKYCRTIDPVSLLPCSPEFLIDRLVAQRKNRFHLLVSATKRNISWLGRKLGI